MTVTHFIRGAACAAVFAFPAYADQHTRTASEVLNHHLAAFGSGDVDRIMSDFAEDAVFISPDGVVVGSDQIRPIFEALVAEFSEPGMSFELDGAFVQDRYAQIHWRAETAANIYHYGSDTFLIEDGMIQMQALSVSVTAK